MKKETPQSRVLRHPDNSVYPKPRNQYYCRFDSMDSREHQRIWRRAQNKTENI